MHQIEHSGQRKVANLRDATRLQLGVVDRDVGVEAAATGRDRVWRHRVAGPGLARAVNQDDLADPLIKQNDIHTREAGPELMATLEKQVRFFTDDWMADAKAKGIDAQAVYDYYVKTAQESAGLMK